MIMNLFRDAFRWVRHNPMTTSGLLLALGMFAEQELGLVTVAFGLTCAGRVIAIVVEHVYSGGLPPDEGGP